MNVDAYADRLARVKQRFVSSLDAKIQDTGAAIARLPDSAPGAAASVSEVYRSLHGIAGIAPTVGFPDTGHTARGAENVVRAAYREQRGLSAEEVSLFTDALGALRGAASRELQSIQDKS